MKKFIPLYKPSISNHEKRNVLSCIKDKWISSKGEFVRKFENSFKEKFKYKFATVTTNGTTALHLALLALNLKKGDEVIVPNLTYISACNAVSYINAKPILADVNKDTWLMDEKTIEKCVSKRTKAIVLVHLYGLPYNFDMIKKIINKYKLKVIEDCAEAIGSKYKNRYVGNFGDISTFSFYGNKTITTGEGGMVVTKNKKIYEEIVKLKSQGLDIFKKNNYYNHEVIGYNYRMTNICAAIGLAQLGRIDSLIKRKKEINKLYNKFLDTSNLTFQQSDKHCSSTYWLINVLFKNNQIRKNVEKKLSLKKIETRPIFVPMNKLKMYKKSDVNLKNSINIHFNGLSLPSYPELKNEEIRYISLIINKTLKLYNSK